jgi:hypothetical protein
LSRKNSWRSSRERSARTPRSTQSPAWYQR